MIKSRLNEFEADWAAMPQIEKEQLQKLNNKTIIVSGHTLARCLCYALIYQSEQQKRGIKVIYAGDSGNFYPECTGSECFTSVGFDNLSEIRQADYIVHTGFCGEKSGSFCAGFAEETKRVNALAQTASRLKAKTVLLSDSRVYGKGRPHRVYAENEYAPLGNTDTDYSDNQLLRVIECLWGCCKKKGGFSLTTLRTGIVLGACSGLTTFIDDMLKAAANGVRYVSSGSVGVSFVLPAATARGASGGICAGVIPAAAAASQRKYFIVKRF